MAVEFKDMRFEVKAALDDVSIGWLYEVSNEIAARAQRNCKMDGETGNQLRGSYQASVDESAGEGKVGSPLESVYWEEWGTGEYAAHGDGRKGWWVYVKDQAPMGGGQTYQSREEAMAVAASMRADSLEAYATNGREPNYTLEKSFDAVKNKAKARLEALLKERVGK